MKTSTFLLLFVSILFAACRKDKPEPDPEPTPTYHTFDGAIYENDNSALLTRDSNILLCLNHGYSDVALVSHKAFDILKVVNSEFMSTIWEEGYYTGYDLQSSAIVESDNGDIFICGKSNPFLIKANALGEVGWIKVYSVGDAATNLIATSDGNLLMASETGNSNGSIVAVHLLKLTTNGDTLWTRTYTNGLQDPTHLLETHHGEYLLMGRGSSNIYMDDAYILRVSSEGESMFEKTFQIGIYSAIELDNGDIIVTGQVRSNTSGGLDMLVFRMDRDGTVLWSNSYGEADPLEMGRSVKRNKDGTFTIAGYAYTLDGSEYLDKQLLLLKVDENGNDIWYKQFGQGDRYEMVYNLLKDPTNDDNILVGKYGFPNENTFIVRTDSAGNFK